MAILYTEDELNLKKCVTFLTEVVASPQTLCTSETDAFRQPLDSLDNVLQSLLAAGSLNLDCVKAVVSAMLAVCERQLAFYLQEEDYTPQQTEMARAAPAYNMQSERIMAMCDSQTRRMPYSRPDYVEARVKSRSNETLKWLQGQTKEQQESVINFARSRGTVARQQKKEQQKKVQAEIVRRMREKARKKDEALRRKVERQVMQIEKEENPGSASVQKLLELAGTTVGQNIEDFILNLLKKPAEVLGCRLLHTWFDRDKDTDTI